MKECILFRFHKHPTVCARRIEILKEKNSSIPIYGLGENLDNIETLYNAGLEHNYTIEEKDSRWKWLNGDLAVLDWYNNFGKNIEFDMLYIIEWDLLLTESISSVYPNLEENNVALSGLIPIEKARDYDWDWVTGNRSHSIEYLRNFINSKDDNFNDIFVGLFPGAAFSRTFLDILSEYEYIPQITNDEARVGVFASLHDEVEIVDTGFYEGWSSDKISETFNCRNNPVSSETIYNSSCDVYHPVRDDINVKNLKL